MNQPKRKLTLSRNRQLSGVCGGIAEFIGWEYKQIRMLVLATTLLSGGSLIIPYIICALVFPKPPKDFDINDFRQY